MGWHPMVLPQRHHSRLRPIRQRVGFAVVARQESANSVILADSAQRTRQMPANTADSVVRRPFSAGFIQCRKASYNAPAERALVMV